ncbi:MAG: sigma-70 family RNA polymerase sigma factor, partial [Myxococcales bacterium]|nr:sigma-70 family RNA polymerase sigma factor [Myxococcales bacterium]
MERSDAELLEASRRGERAAFATLVERYQGVVCAVSYSRTGDRALSEDVAQDTFLAAWRQLHQVREVHRLRAWLCGIARNLSLKARRKRARETPVEDELEQSASADLFEQVSDRQAERLVRDALHRVPEIYRDALVLYYHEQQSAREVALALGISEAAVLQRLARGRQLLAAGVSGLVERALRGPLPRQSLVVGVLAALPALAPSHASATTTATTYGGTMLKVALVTCALAAAGTAVYVTKSSSSARAPTPAVVAASPAAAQAALAPAARPTAAAAAAAAAATPAATTAPADPATAASEAPGAPCPDAPGGCDNSAPALEALPLVDAATSARLGLRDGPSRGAADAPVTITMFTDLQCKFCGEALGGLDQLLEDYPGKLRIVIKQFPVRKNSDLAAEAALAAEAQGKFWDLYDLMMANQDSLSPDGLLALAKRAGLDGAAFQAALSQRTYRAAVEQSMAAGKEL